MFSGFMHSRINNYFNTTNNDYSKSVFSIVIVNQWTASVGCFQVSCIPGSIIIIIGCFRVSCIPGSMIASIGCFQFMHSRINDYYNRMFSGFMHSKINNYLNTANNDYSKSVFSIVIVNQWTAEVRSFRVHAFQDQ